MEKFLIAFALFLSLGVSSAAAPKDFAGASPQQLIDALALIKCPAPGLDGTGVYSAFLAENSRPELRMGVLGQRLPCVPEQMRELVRRGVSVLPLLIRHLDDARPTQLIVGKLMGDDLDIVGVQYFSDEYDPRQHEPDTQVCQSQCLRKEFDGKYKVRIGDVCYVLIGQIVGRNLIAIRYQPTANLVVNSPIEAPWLAGQVEKDWGNIDAQGLMASFMSDIHASKDMDSYGPALARLRFYFPGVYASLKGDDLAKRISFENEGKSRASVN